MSTLSVHQIDIFSFRLYGRYMATKKGKQVREVAVSFVRRLPLIEKQCATCGRAFIGTKKGAYCSQACKSRANYLKHAEKRRRHRVEKYQAERKAAAQGKG